MLKEFGSLVRGAVSPRGLGALPLVGCGGDADDGPPAEGDQAVSNPLSRASSTPGGPGERCPDGRAGTPTPWSLSAKPWRSTPTTLYPSSGPSWQPWPWGTLPWPRTMREKLAVTGPELLEMLGPGGAMGGMPIAR